MESCRLHMRSSGTGILQGSSTRCFRWFTQRLKLGMQLGSLPTALAATSLDSLMISNPRVMNIFRGFLSFHACHVRLKGTAIFARHSFLRELKIIPRAPITAITIPVTITMVSGTVLMKAPTPNNMNSTNNTFRTTHLPELQPKMVPPSDTIGLLLVFPT